MSLSIRLDLKQTQGLVLTPQLQQAIKLLQYSNQELIDAVQNEAVSNPFITVIAPASGSESSAPVQAPGVAAPPSAGSPASDHRLSVRSLTRNSGDDSLTSAIDRLTDKPSLRQHVVSQILTGPRPS